MILITDLKLPDYFYDIWKEALASTDIHSPISTQIEEGLLAEESDIQKIRQEIIGKLDSNYHDIWQIVKDWKDASSGCIDHISGQTDKDQVKKHILKASKYMLLSILLKDHFHEWLLKKARATNTEHNMAILESQKVLSHEHLAKKQLTIMTHLNDQAQLDFHTKDFLNKFAFLGFKEGRAWNKEDIPGLLKDVNPPEEPSRARAISDLDLTVEEDDYLDIYQELLCNEQLFLESQLMAAHNLCKDADNNED